MIMKKAIIGITTFNERREKGRYNAINYDYIKSIREVGGIPFIIPLDEDKDNISDYIEIIDGLVLSGGEDINPKYFGEEPNLNIGEIDGNRDKFEFELFRKAIQKNIPVLGICRGLQVINVAMGGSVYQDIDTQVENVILHHFKGVSRQEMTHKVFLKKDTIFSKIFNNKEYIYTNSFHHQSIKKVGKNLEVLGYTADNLVEALISKEYPQNLILGVQFHPENLTKIDNFSKIFQLFINFAEKNKELL